MGKATGKPGPDKGQGGREPLLTKRLSNAIVRNRAKMGMPEGLCGEAEGIDFTTVSKWKNRGSRALQQWASLKPKERAKELIFVNFFKALRTARPRFIKANCETIEKAVRRGDWRAADRRLQWEDPEHFGKHMKLSGDPTLPAVSVRSETPAEEESRMKRAREVLEAYHDTAPEQP